MPIKKGPDQIPNMLKYGNRFRCMISLDPNLAERLALYISRQGEASGSTARTIVRLVDQGLRLEEARIVTIGPLALPQVKK